MSRYTVLLYREPDESAYNVVVPSMPGCFTYGATVDQALERAREAMEGWLLAERDRGGDLPEEDAPPLVASVELADILTTPA
jgi:antitoxin HicB